MPFEVLCSLVLKLEQIAHELPSGKAIKMTADDPKPKNCRSDIGDQNFMLIRVTLRKL
jgi:hypothetical protein